MTAAPVTLEDSAEGVLNQIDGATRETRGGKFLNFKKLSGNPWDIDTDEIIW
jgi:hypothetical protein